MRGNGVVRLDAYSVSRSFDLEHLIDIPIFGWSMNPPRLRLHETYLPINALCSGAQQNGLDCS